MGSAHESHMVEEAHKTARHLFEDVRSGRPNGLERAIDEIITERQNHSPAEYKQYLAVLNRDVQRVLPDFTIVGATDIGDTKSLRISQRSGPRSLDKNDGRDMRIEMSYQAMLADQAFRKASEGVALKR